MIRTIIRPGEPIGDFDTLLNTLNGWAEENVRTGPRRVKLVCTVGGKVKQITIEEDTE